MIKSTFVILLIACIFPFNNIVAQEKAKPDHDSTFFETYPDKITGRFYFSQKYTSVEFEAPKDQDALRYRPNTTLNMGIGATYKMVTLNLAYGFGFLNPERGQGKTKYLDLQSHIYGHKWTIDLFGQFYKGYYLTPKRAYAEGNNSYYVRPDMRVNLVGIAAYRIMNEKNFSYSAAFMQNAWQKKSAGTFLLGGEIYYGVTKGDSNFIPQKASGIYNQQGINNIRFASIGPGAGYAYTLVMLKNLFLTGSLVVNFDMGFSRESGPAIAIDRFTFSPNCIYRLAFGYNSRNWNINASLVNNRINVNSAASSDGYIFNTGNYRLTYAKRFTPGPKLHKKLLFLDKLQKSK